jgi:hypothetical protein
MGYVTEGFGQLRMLSGDHLMHRKNARLNDDARSILSPRSANPLEQGEWLVLDDEGTYDRYDAADAGPALAYVVVSRRGQSDVQAVGAPEIYTKDEGVQFETTTYDPDGVYEVGTRLKVNLLTFEIGGEERDVSVLTPADTDLDNVVAIVLRPPETPADFTKMTCQRASGVLGVAAGGGT